MQLVNWLMFYRDNFYGKSFSQIVAEAPPPKVEVEGQAELLPSEIWFERLRLDAEIV